MNYAFCPVHNILLGVINTNCCNRPQISVALQKKDLFLAQTKSKADCAQLSWLALYKELIQRCRLFLSASFTTWGFFMSSCIHRKEREKLGDGAACFTAVFRSDTHLFCPYSICQRCQGMLGNVVYLCMPKKKVGLGEHLMHIVLGMIAPLLVLSLLGLSVGTISEKEKELLQI